MNTQPLMLRSSSAPATEPWPVNTLPSARHAFSRIALLGWLILWAIALPVFDGAAAVHWEPYVFQTLAGATTQGFADGSGSAARFKQPEGIYVDGTGTVYVADKGNHAIRKIAPNGSVTTVVGFSGSSGYMDGSLLNARLSDPSDVVVDTDGSLVINDAGNKVIRRAILSGPNQGVTTMAGQAGWSGGVVDGTNSAAKFSLPSGLAKDGHGSFYVTELSGVGVRKIAPSGQDWVVTTIPGGDSSGRFTIGGPYDLSFDATGNCFVSDINFGGQIWKLPAGSPTWLKFCGNPTGTSLHTNDGMGASVEFEGPWGTASDGTGNVFVTDGAATIRKLTPAGVSTTLAGFPELPGSADGTGSAARFRNPTGIAVDTAGNVYVVDTGNHMIRKGWPAPVPAIRLSGDLSFGNVTVGTNAMRTMTITNSGNEVLNVAGISYPAGFSGPSFSGAIAVGGYHDVTITFTPVSGVSYDGVVLVESDAPINLASIPVHGTGAARIIALAGTLDFGNVEALQSTNRILILRNNGNAPLTVSGLTFPDGFSGGFSGTINAGGSVNVTMTFTPVTNKNYSGTVTVNSDATSGANTAFVSGTGTPFRTRLIGLSGNLTFGGVEAGRSATRVLTIANAGEAAFYVTSIVLTDGDGFTADFRGIVDSHRSRTVAVAFAPPGPGAYHGTFTVNCNANGGTTNFDVSGEGTPVLSREISLSGDLNFGAVAERSIATRVLTISNLGVAPIMVSNIVYPDGFSGSFTGAIPAHGSRKVSVNFHPLTVTNYAGYLRVLSDANGGVSSNLVSGTGAPAALRPKEGTYAGLFYQDDAVHHESSGFFKLTAKRGGAYSFWLFVAGKRYPGDGTFSGRFAFDGMATNVIRRRGKDSVTVVWKADPDGADQITGTIGAQSWEATNLFGSLPGYAALTNNAPQAGRYTVLFPGIPGASESPAGDGFGTVSVSTRGLVSFAGTLADGTKVTQAASLSAGGVWPFYASLYGGRGSMLGWLTFSNAPAEDLSGRVSWIRPPAVSKSKLYPGGFEVDSESIGSRYTPPVGKTNRVVAITNGVITLSGGNLSEPLTAAVVLRANKKENNTVSNASPHKLTMTITLASGLFSGKLTPVGSKTGIKFQGVILQRTNSVGYGAGFFLQTNLSGRVSFERAAP